MPDCARRRVAPSSQDISRRRLDTSVVVLGLGLGLEQKSLASARLVDTAHSEPLTTSLQLLAVYEVSRVCGVCN